MTSTSFDGATAGASCPIHGARTRKQLTDRTCDNDRIPHYFITHSVRVMQRYKRFEGAKMTDTLPGGTTSGLQ